MKVIARNLFERPVILLFLTLTCLIPLSPFIQACPPDTHDCGSETAALAAASAAIVTAADSLDKVQSRLDAARSEFDRLSGERDGALSDHRAALTRRDTDRRDFERARRDSNYAAGAIYLLLIAAEVDWPSILLAIALFHHYEAERWRLREALAADEAAVRDSKARYDSARRAVWVAESELSTAESLYDAAKAVYDAARLAYDRALGAWSSCTGS